MAKLESITGRAISGEWGFDDENGTGIPVLRTTNFTNEGIIDFSDVVTRTITKKDLTSKYLRPGDIIIEKSGGSDKQPVGRVVYYSGEENAYLFNNFTGVLRVIDSSCWDSKYLFYALYANYLKGGTRKYQNKTTGLHNLKTDRYIKEFEVLEHPIQKQKQISTIFDRICELISFRKQQLAKLDELVRARFVEMFGDCRVNNKGFEQFKGDELFKFSSGKFLPEEKRKGCGVPVYGGNGIAWYTDTFLVEYPTIIIGRVGAQCGNIHLVTEPVWITDNAIYIKEQKTDKFCLKFLSELMMIMNFYQYADFSGQPKITQKPLENTLYLVPPVKLQEQFSDFAGKVGRHQLTIQQGLEQLETLKKSLMQAYFG